MENKFSVFFLIMIWAMMSSINVKAQEKTGLQPIIFDIQHLEKIKEESLADFLHEINARDIFSSPDFETPKKVIYTDREVIMPKLELVYRGNIEMGKNKIAMIEVMENGSNRSYFLKIGESVKGFRIVDIQREFVVLYSQDKGEKKLFLSSKEE